MITISIPAPLDGREDLLAQNEATEPQKRGIELLKGVQLPLFALEPSQPVKGCP